MALNYLLDPMFQIENSAGKPATDGWLEVYVHGTRNKYYCASNFDGTLHPFKIKLDSLGSNIVLADDEQSYDVYAYNRFGSLLMSRYNVKPGSGGGSGGTIGSLQHWLGMYGPTYTHFPGDLAGHTLGIPRQSVDYEGDFIDHIETAPYPDGAVPAYIYLKPGLYLVECVIRYQQDSEDLKNTLDEVLVYTGHGNANEDVAYQLDASGPETNGNRHCLKQAFIRKVTETDGSLLYFAPGTPTDWTDAYIQTLSIVKLDSVAHDIGLQEVYHDDTMTGNGTPNDPLSIQDALDGKQDTLTAGEGIILDSDGNISVDKDVIQEKLTAGDNITIDSDGVISTEGRKYTEGWGIDVDNDNNVISADPDEVQRKLTAGVGINLDSDGNISGNYRGGYNIEVTGNTINKLGHKLIATNNVSYTYCKVFDFTWQYVYGRGQTVFTATHYGGNFVTFSVTLIRAVGTSYTVAWPYVVAASPNMIKPTAFIEKLEIRESGNRIIGYLKLRNFSQNQFWLDWEGHSDAGYVTFTPQLTNEPEGDIAWTCEVSNYNVPYYQDEINSNFQQKLTAGDNITIDSDGVISATVPEHVQADWAQDNSEDPSYIRNKPDLSEYQKALTAGDGILLDSDGNISVDKEEIQEKLTPGDGIEINSDGVISNTYEQVQADWEQDDSADPSYIQNKPDLSVYQKELTAGEGINLDSDGNISVDTDVIQEKLTPGDGIDIDENGVISNTFEQVQSDWAQEDDSEPDYIKNKPDMDDYQKALTAGEGIILDSDGNISVDKEDVQEKLTPGEGINIDSDGVITADPQVQSDWEQDDSEEPDYIRNKPDLSIYQKELTAGDGIILDSDGNISVDKETIQEKLTPGDGITIDNEGVISADPQVQSDWEEEDTESPAYIQNKPDLSEYQKELTAGDGITIINNIISVDSDSVQEKLTPGEGINIDSDGVITAEGKRYTEGWGIDIDDEHDVISVDPDIIQQKLTPGEGITIDSDGNIDIDLPPVKPLIAGDGITIEDADGVVRISTDAVLANELDPDQQLLRYEHHSPTWDPYAQGWDKWSYEQGNTYVRFGYDTVAVPMIEMYGSQFEGFRVRGMGGYPDVDYIDSEGNTVARAPFITNYNGLDTSKLYLLNPLSSYGAKTYQLVEGQKKLTAGQGIEIDSDGNISATVDGSNVFIAHVNVTSYDDIKAALDDGKIVVALDGRIQFSVCSDWTEIWSQPCVMFGRMTDQYQGGFPARTLWSCRKDGDNTIWTRHYNNQALAVKTDLNEKQDKLTAGQNITIDSDGVISAAGGEQVQADWEEDDSEEPSYIQNKPTPKTLTAGQNITITENSSTITIDADFPTYTAGNGINIDNNGEVSVKTGNGLDIDSDGNVIVDTSVIASKNYVDSIVGDIQTILEGI